MHHITPEDVEVVLSRLPEEAYNRLRAVHFDDWAWGNRRLGYTTTRGRREIALCALPKRMSFTLFFTAAAITPPVWRTTGRTMARVGDSAISTL